MKTHGFPNDIDPPAPRSSRRNLMIGGDLTVIALGALALIARQTLFAKKMPVEGAPVLRPAVLPGTIHQMPSLVSRGLPPTSPLDLDAIQQLIDQLPFQERGNVFEALILHAQESNLDTLRLLFDQEGAQGLSLADWIARLNQIRGDHNHPLHSGVKIFLESCRSGVREMAHQLSTTSLDELLPRLQMMREGLRGARAALSDRGRELLDLAIQNIRTRL
ncbi:MAG: hypothetical protein JSR80_02425 [Verrucomicrobia bacterium]|nr:hypothetical protein [Verrucomicrobiota bacterium]